MNKKIAVLVVEDECLIRLDLVDKLEGLGFETREASTAAEAIEVMNADQSIRIVVTDVEMPGRMNGLALAHYIRERWPPTALIVTSGRKNPTDTELPPNAHFLSKPHAPGELKRLIEVCLSAI